MTRRDDCDDVFVAVAVSFSSCSKTRARQLAAAKSRDLLPLAFTFTVIRGKIRSNYIVLQNQADKSEKASGGRFRLSFCGLCQQPQFNSMLGSNRTNNGPSPSSNRA